MKAQISRFLDTLDRSPNTIKAYRSALVQFARVCGLSPTLDTETYIEFLVTLKNLSPSTQRLYRTAVLKFYHFCKAGNPIALQEATEHYTRRPGKRIVNFNREAIEQVISHCISLKGNLLNLRDKAFVLTLIDTGLRITEACNMKRGDMDWQARRAVIIGKGDKQAIIRFSPRSITAIQDYLKKRGKVEPNSKKPLSSQPLFARHDISASRTIKPIKSGGMWKAIKDRMTEAGIDRQSVRIHDFRHYFVTMTLLAKGSLKLSQELARHESISTTNRYAHFAGEVDAAYEEIFNK